MKKALYLSVFWLQDFLQNGQLERLLDYPITLIYPLSLTYLCPVHALFMLFDTWLMRDSCVIWLLFVCCFNAWWAGFCACWLYLYWLFWIIPFLHQLRFTVRLFWFHLMMISKFSRIKIPNYNRIIGRLLMIASLQNHCLYCLLDYCSINLFIFLMAGRTQKAYGFPFSDDSFLNCLPQFGYCIWIVPTILDFITTSAENPLLYSVLKIKKNSCGILLFVTHLQSNASAGSLICIDF